MPTFNSCPGLKTQPPLFRTSLLLIWDRHARIYRLLRGVRDKYKEGQFRYSEKITFGLQPKLLHVKREYWGLIVCVFGLRFHYQRSYGGRYA